MVSGGLLPQATRRGWLAAGFTVVALMLGGGGSPSPVAEILVQLAFAAAALGWIWWAKSDAHSGIPRSLWALAALVLAVPLLHLVPLPPILWQALPGRALETGLLGLVGAADGWRPLSISPWRTFAALLAIIPAAGLMLAVASLGARDRRLVIVTVALVGVVGAFLGALQLAGGDQGAFQLYEKSHRGWLTGFFANRNAAVDALLIGSLALTTWLALRAEHRPASGSALAIFFLAQASLLLAAVLTGSRAGIALIPVALVVQYAMLRQSRLRARYSRIAIAAAGLAAVLLAVPVLLGGNARLSGVAARFDAIGDVRAELWRDSWAAVEAFWPAGSGLGTFTRAFLPYERFEVVDQFFPNRAHNDYLEFLLEAGVVAPVVLFAALVVLAVLARRALGAGREARIEAMFAIGTLTILALHSVVDYPLRTMALAALAGIAAGILAAPRKGGQRG